MIGSDLLLDTNAAIAWMNESPDVPRVVLSFANPGLPLPVLAELKYGARNFSKREKNLQSIEELLQAVRLILPDRDTARVFGEIQASLKQSGRPIPINDIWIAAMARQFRVPLLTRDRHFHHVEGVDVLTW